MNSIEIIVAKVLQETQTTNRIEIRKEVVALLKAQGNVTINIAEVSKEIKRQIESPNSSSGQSVNQNHSTIFS